MWNNQLSTVNSEKLIYAQLHGINYIIPDAFWYGAPNGEYSLPLTINIVHGKGKLKPNPPRARLAALGRDVPVTWNVTGTLPGQIGVFAVIVRCCEQRKHK